MPYNPGIQPIGGQLLAQGIGQAFGAVANKHKRVGELLKERAEEAKVLRKKAKGYQNLVKIDTEMANVLETKLNIPAESFQDLSIEKQVEVGDALMMLPGIKFERERNRSIEYQNIMAGAQLPYAERDAEAKSDTVAANRDIVKQSANRAVFQTAQAGEELHHNREMRELEKRALELSNEFNQRRLDSYGANAELEAMRAATDAINAKSNYALAVLKGKQWEADQKARGTGGGISELLGLERDEMIELVRERLNEAETPEEKQAIIDVMQEAQKIHNNFESVDAVDQAIAKLILQGLEGNKNTGDSGLPFGIKLPWNKEKKPETISDIEKRYESKGASRNNRNGRARWE